MKVLVVYYSLEGNTDFIAQKLVSNTKADSLRLKPKKAYPTGNFKKYFWGGKSVMFGEKPELEDYHVAMEDYDTIVIGTPVWAGSYAPPVKSFLAENKIEGKNIYLVACHGGGGTVKCFKKLKEALDNNNIIAEVDFLDPLKHQSESMNDRVNEFCKKIRGEG